MMDAFQLNFDVLSHFNNLSSDHIYLYTFVPLLDLILRSMPGYAKLAGFKDFYLGKIYAGF